MIYHKEEFVLKILVLCSLVFLLSISAEAQNGSGTPQPVAAVTFLDSTKDQDGLIGSVRRVQTESTRLVAVSGKLTEGPRQLVEVTTYDLRGRRIENASYPITNSPTGKEEYKRDDKGNLVEMTVRGDDGSILSREVYTYEFDDVGNWTKMVTALVVFEDGKLKYEPVELTYRNITYYFDETIAKLVKTTSTATAPVIPSGRQSVISYPENLAERPTRLVTDPGLLVPSNIYEAPPAIPKRVKQPKQAGSSRPKAAPEVLRSVEGPPVTVRPAEVTRSAVRPSGNAGLTKPASATEAPISKTAPPRGSPTLKNAIELYRTGRERFDTGDFKAAADAFTRSIEAEPAAAEVHLNLGLAYLKLKKHAEAVKAFKQAIRLEPNLVEAHYGLGLEYFNVARYKDSADAFKEATRLSPNMAKNHYALALAYQELGKDDLVVEEYKVLQRLDAGLAQRLSKTFPDFNLPCRVPPYCK